ncbi:MAG TPA: PEP-CTERM-box response regulator transcription factor [Methylomirabilota bacterium]|nr:PEP-CTERM-box response regulator transcription factor [Methylomirabilota bacterium]
MRNVKPALLIVDDDEDIRSQMKWGLAADYEVLVAENRADALARLREKKPTVVLLDLGLPPHPGNPHEGFATLSDILAHDRLTKVIIISGQSEKANALRAVGEGAYDFLSKPVELDELKLILKRAFHVAQLEREYRKMQQQLTTDTFEGMLGSSPRMQEIFASIRKVATTDAAVLILGESGTGKEMAAQAIHRRSARKDGPFVAINCGAIPEALLESELFGHEKGSFTGAHAQRKGRIELAAGGTLFLDEIGELPLQLQVKLLRFLQEKTLERVGGRSSIEVDTRVIAATNKDLKVETEQGRFREDLYYRIAVVVLKLPALRERAGDVALLAQAFLRRCAAESGKEPPRFSDDAVRALERHPWPGNVRELENRVKRAFIMSEGRRITSSDLELSAAGGAAAARTLKEAREEVEREVIGNALRRNNGTVSRAAEELGISRPTLYELMEKLGIRNE